jgi:hypothetical protein
LCKKKLLHPLAGTCVPSPYFLLLIAKLSHQMVVNDGIMHEEGQVRLSSVFFAVDLHQASAFEPY